MTPKIKATNPRRKARLLIIGIRELRRAPAPKMTARIPKICCSFCFICELLISSKLDLYSCEIVFFLDKIRADVNLYRDSSHRNFFLDIFSENDKIVLMKT